MNETTYETKEKETIMKRKRFNEHYILVKITFIYNSLVLAWAVVTCALFYAIQPDFLTWFIIIPLLIIIALVGLIMSSLSFRKGFNIYSLLGVCFSIIVIAVYIGLLVGIIGLWFQR